VTDREEESGERGDEEMIEAYLLCMVDVGASVDVCENLDSVFGDVDNALCCCAIVADARGGEEVVPMDQDPHLVGAEVKENLKAMQ
jgi:hypothetical protein